MNEEPLIWTVNGNVPERGLTLKVEWFITEEYIKVVKRHFDKDGEMVKEGADILSLRGVTGESVVGRIG
jgi:hypothetical protein